MAEEKIDNYPTYTQAFDVVLIKDGVNSMTAKPDDFKRVPVVAADTVQACLHDDVAKEKGFYPLYAVPPGVMGEPEVLAVRRIQDPPTHPRDWGEPGK